MSNPDPNLRRERERHSGPLIGLALVVIFALALIFWWMMDEAADAPGPDSTTTIEQNDVDVAPPAAEGEGAVDAPDAVTPDVVTPAPVPDQTPAPDAGGGTTAAPRGVRPPIREEDDSDTTKARRRQSARLFAFLHP